MSRKRKLIGAGIAAVVLLVVARLVFAPSRVDVEIAVVRSDSLRVTVDDEGRTRARDRYTVAAPVTGRLQRITLDVGDSVSAGMIVARLGASPEDSRTLSGARARVASAEARRTEMQTRVTQTAREAAQAQREAERRRALAEAGALSEEAVEQANLAATAAAQSHDAAKAALHAADADVDAARATLIGGSAETSAGGLTSVRSPVSGRVLRVREEDERVVPAGTPLLEIADPGGLEIVVDVLSEDAVRISAGDPVIITSWGGDATLHGRVRIVEPAAFTQVSALGVEEQRVNVIADLDAHPPSLGTGYRVQASVIVWQQNGVLTVPTSAIYRRDNAWRTFVVIDGTAHERELTIGHRGRDAAEVLGGIEAGEQVVVYPSDEIADGVRVRLRR